MQERERLRHAWLQELRNVRFAEALASRSSLKDSFVFARPEENGVEDINHIRQEDKFSLILRQFLFAGNCKHRMSGIFLVKIYFSIFRARIRWFIAYA